MADASEYQMPKKTVRIDVKASRQEPKPKLQVSVNALKLDLKALEEKLEGLQQAISVHGGGVVRLEGLEVSLLATFVVAPSVSAEDIVKYQMKLTCGEDYPAEPPSVDWQDCPVEPKPNLEHIPSTINWNVKKPKPQLADVLTDLRNVIVEDHGTKKKSSKGKRNSAKDSKGKKKSDSHGRE